MSDKFFFKGRKTPKPEYGESGYNTKRMTKPGTAVCPIKVFVQSEQRKLEVQAIADEHNIHSCIFVDEGIPENIKELTGLLNKPVSVKVIATQNRNELCLCESGKKFKKCCGKK